MREILFRGKRVDNDEWFEGDLCHRCGNLIIEHNDTLQSYEVNPETIGQFTGLCDKNGKKIFEGDIVKFACKGNEDIEKEYIYEVYYADGGFCLKDDELSGICLIQHFMDYSIEVIGNVHDNPELLEDV